MNDRDETRARFATSATPNPEPPSPIPNPPSRRVLIRIPNWVGDVVMALPALRELRRIFRDSQITIAARPWVAGLLEGEALADKLIPVHDSGPVFKRAVHFIIDARRLRNQRFDYAVLLTNSFGSALAARIGGAKHIAGYATDGRRPLLNHAVSFEPNYKTLHQVRYYLNIAAQIETRLTGAGLVDFKHCEPRLHASEEATRRARLMIEGLSLETAARAVSRTARSSAEAGAAGLHAEPSGHRSPATRQRPILAINPGATNSTAKRWPAERFGEVADRLNQDAGFQTVIVGADGDRAVAGAVAAVMRTPAVVLAGKTSIAELKGVLSCAQLVVSNDTGAAHVSAALGVPTVVVFGPTEHIATRPFSGRAAVVRHNVECSPCMLRECPIDHRCMTGVRVEDVYRSAIQLLDETD